MTVPETPDPEYNFTGPFYVQVSENLGPFETIMEARTAFFAGPKDGKSARVHSTCEKLDMFMVRRKT